MKNAKNYAVARDPRRVTCQNALPRGRPPVRKSRVQKDWEALIYTRILSKGERKGERRIASHTRGKEGGERKRRPRKERTSNGCTSP